MEFPAPSLQKTEYHGHRPPLILAARQGHQKPSDEGQEGHREPAGQGYTVRSLTHHTPGCVVPSIKREGLRKGPTVTMALAPDISSILRNW